MSEKKQDEAERLAEEHAPYLNAKAIITEHELQAKKFRGSFKAGFRAGEKSEKVMRLFEAADKFRVATCKYADGEMSHGVFTMHLDQISEHLAAFEEKDGE